MTVEEVEQQWFPIDQCVSTFAEISMWTSLEDCLAACRFIESRALSTDQPSDRLIVPFPDNSSFEAVLMECIKWLIEGYRVPEAKVTLARLIDPAIKDSTVKSLLDFRYLANIQAGGAGSIEHYAPQLGQHRDDRFLLVTDNPVAIELLQNPFRCMIDMIGRFWPTAEQTLELMSGIKKTGGTPRVTHKPYSDGPLAALVEALVFYVHTIDLGPRFRSEPGADIALGYRSVEICSRPPIDQRFMEVSQQIAEEMFKNLA